MDDTIRETRNRALKDENRQLKGQLRQLWDQARENEQKQMRMLEIEARLIGAEGLRALLDVLFHDLKAANGLDMIGLAVVDEGQELALLLEEECPQIPPTLFLLDAADAVHARLSRFYVGPYDPPLHDDWFGKVHELRGVALVPLRRGDKLLGRLHLGTRDPQRYAEGVGTYFIERLAAVTAVCIENAVNIQRLKQFGVTDTLTGIKNRRYFDQRLVEEVARAQREDSPLGCLFVDIDKFKRINDNLGHPVGDAVIAETASRIASQLRTSDVLARYGGEEFVVLLPAMDRMASWEIAERIRCALADEPVAYRVDGADGRLDVTVSLGLACVTPRAGSDPRGVGESLLRRADDALLEAKEKGRNRVVTADCVEA